jgi:hypothetical protein
MRDPEQKQPIRPEDATEFDSSGFVQLGPNDVSYRVRTQPKMVHQYVIGDVLGEGICLLLFSYPGCITFLQVHMLK